MRDPASTSAVPRDPELAALSDAHPGWIAAGSGPDVRVLSATRDGRILAVLDATGLAAKIAASERAR